MRFSLPRGRRPARQSRQQFAQAGQRRQRQARHLPDGPLRSFRSRHPPRNATEAAAFSRTLVELCQLDPSPHRIHRDLELLGDLTDRRPHDRASFTTCSRNFLGHASTCRLLIAGALPQSRPRSAAPPRHDARFKCPRKRRHFRVLPTGGRGRQARMCGTTQPGRSEDLRAHAAVTRAGGRTQGRHFPCAGRGRRRAEPSGGAAGSALPPTARRKAPARAERRLMPEAAPWENPAYGIMGGGRKRGPERNREPALRITRTSIRMRARAGMRDA